MVDAVDSKSTAREGVLVRVRLRVRCVVLLSIPLWVSLSRVCFFLIGYSNESRKKSEEGKRGL